MNNKGFSLVELIMVVAIMSILIGTVGYGLSFSSGKAAEECAYKLSNELQSARTLTSGKYKVELLIYKDDAKGIVLKETVYKNSTDTGTSTEYVVGSDDVKIELESSNTSKSKEIKGGESGDTASLKFSRSTGALNPDADGDYNKCFKISKANKTFYVKIVPLTGRISVETS